MNSSGVLLDTGGIIFVSLYLFSLVFIGLAGRYARKENSLSDFYLSGRGMGLFVLLLTLYATQYSGNSLIGFTGQSYRKGYWFIMSVITMMSIIGGYLMFAPKLQKLSRKYNFITIGNYIQHRFNSNTLTILITISCIIALANFILTNLKAIGYVVEASTGGAISFEAGIIFLSVIMIIYETLGGMRSVAWTDAIQGVLLLVGVAAIFIIISFHYGGLPATAEIIKNTRPEFWAPPTLEQKNLWLSTMMIVVFGVSVYPHAIQRIYSAKNAKVLKRSLQIMVFMPLVTTFFMYIIGLVGAAHFPGLSKQESDSIAMVLLNDISNQVPGANILIVMFIAAILAAIMSTVDSALLAISSLFTEDIYKKIKPGKEQSHLTKVGKVFSWIVMGLMAYSAIVFPETIWRLIEIKLELLCQVAPAVFLGINMKSIKTKEVLAGFIVGTIISVTIILLNIYIPSIPGKPLGFHAGVWGLAANLLVIFSMKLKNKY